MNNLKDKKIVIVGLGLIGGSIACAIAEKNLCNNVWAVGRNQDTLAEAKASGAISDFDVDLQAACANADLIIIAVPGLTVAPILKQLSVFVSESTIITDVASVKKSTIDAARSAFGKIPANLVPGHPIAGSEKSGFSAAKAGLYKGKKVILTPVAETSKEALLVVTELWAAIGADVLEMTVKHHDEVLAATSHLPHLLAYALVDTLSQQGESEEIFRYAAGGFRDFTRIASSDPEMWRDVFLANGEATIDILDQFTNELKRLRQALVDGDADTLMSTFVRAKKSRDNFNER